MFTYIKISSVCFFKEDKDGFFRYHEIQYTFSKVQYRLCSPKNSTEKLSQTYAKSGRRLVPDELKFLLFSKPYSKRERLMDANSNSKYRKQNFTLTFHV